MRDGLDHDDIYMMVEDEFYSVCKTFTQHLHHAEYVRQKELAKARNVSTISAISRPVDTSTKMRAETAKRREKELNAEKAKAALNQIHRQAAARRPKTDADEGEEERIAMKDDAPWAGTALQNFMASPSRAQKSLAGLHAAEAGTRAAAGFSGPAVKQVSSSRTFDLKPSSSKDSRREKGYVSKSESTTSGEDDDDLDALPRGRGGKGFVSALKPAQDTVHDPLTRYPIKDRTEVYNNAIQMTSNRHVQKKEASHRSAAREPSGSPPHPKSILKRPRATPGFDSFDNLPLPSSLGGDALRRRAKRKLDAKARDLEHERRRVGDVSEIPIFLV
jgi:hypothetical protein